MQLAVDCAGFSAAEADQLRQAMGSKRSQARMARMRERLMAGHGRARHHRRHRRGDLHEARGVLELRVPREPLGELRLPRVLELVDQVPLPGRVRGLAAERAADGLLLAAHDRARRAPARRAGARSRSQRVAPRRHARTAHRRRRADRPGAGARVPRRAVAPRGAARAAVGARVCTTRCSTTSTTSAPSAPFTDLEDFVRRTGATVDQVEALATAGAFEQCFGQSRRSALWAAGALGTARPQRAARRRGRRDPARRRHRRRRAGAAGHDRDGDGRRRPVGDGHLASASTPPSSCATELIRRRASSPRPTCATSPTARRGGRRGGDAPPAAGDREGHGVPQPRGRDRPRQRDLHQGHLEAVPHGGPAVRRRCGCAGCSKAPGRDQPRRRAGSPACRSASPTDSAPATSTECAVHGSLPLPSGGLRQAGLRFAPLQRRDRERVARVRDRRSCTPS